MITYDLAPAGQMAADLSKWYSQESSPIVNVYHERALITGCFMYYLEIHFLSSIMCPLSNMERQEAAISINLRNRARGIVSAAEQTSAHELD